MPTPDPAALRILLEQLEEVDLTQKLTLEDRELIDDVTTALAEVADYVEAAFSPETYQVRRHGEPDVKVRARKVRLSEHHVELLDADGRTVFVGPTATTDARLLDDSPEPPTFHPVSGAAGAVRPTALPTLDTEGPRS